MKGMVHNIGILMLDEGLLSREALERALARKRREGGSLALNLVLEGAVDEVSLAQFYARKLRLEPATEDMLRGVDVATFSLIPLEIIYDNGILPLYLQDEETLVVGLVDPTDPELLAEASFFSGFNLLARMVTVGQMARHFARLARQPWKITVGEAAGLWLRQQAPAVPEFGVDELLEQTTALDHPLEKALQASLDETYGGPTVQMESPFEEAGDEPSGPAAGAPGGPSIWVGGRAVGEISNIRIQPPRGREDTGPIVVREQDLDRVEVSTSKMPALTVQDEPIETAFARVSLKPEAWSEVGLGPPESEQPQQTAPEVMEGEAVTATGKVKILGFSLDHVPTEPAVYAQTAPEPVIAAPSVGFTERPKSKVPARPAAVSPGVDIGRHVHLLTRLEDALGPTDDLAGRATDAILARLGEVRRRDELGDSVVDGLAHLYETVALLTLNGPRAVIWRCRLGGVAAPEMVGRAIDIEQRGVIHRVSEERVFYWGPLPQESRIRATFGVTHKNPVLLVPVELRGKTVLNVYLDAGEDAFRSPGAHLERLLVDLSRGLERVILLRRRGRRKT